MNIEYFEYFGQILCGEINNKYLDEFSDFLDTYFSELI